MHFSLVLNSYLILPKRFKYLKVVWST